MRQQVAVIHTHIKNIQTLARAHTHIHRYYFVFDSLFYSFITLWIFSSCFRKMQLYVLRYLYICVLSILEIEFSCRLKCTYSEWFNFDGNESHECQCITKPKKKKQTNQTSKYFYFLMVYLSLKSWLHLIDCTLIWFYFWNDNLLSTIFNDLTYLRIMDERTANISNYLTFLFVYFTRIMIHLSRQGEPNKKITLTTKTLFDIVLCLSTILLQFDNFRWHSIFLYDATAFLHATKCLKASRKFYVRKGNSTHIGA